jgi:hypothetical protein
MVRAGLAEHRLGQPALLTEPVVGASGQLLDRVRGEELPGDAPGRGLLGDRRGAVLAELGDVPSKPFFWLTRSSVRAVRRTPICSQDRASAAVTPATPAAWSGGGDTARRASSASSDGASRPIVILAGRSGGLTFQP